MKNIRNRVGMAAIAAMVTVVAGLPACTRSAPPAADNPWAELAQWPDWSGFWEFDWRNERAAQLAAAQQVSTAPQAPAPQTASAPPSSRQPAMKLRPEAQARRDAYAKAREKGENEQTQAANCVPPGLPGILTQPYPIEFLYQPGKVVMLTEAFMQFRHIFTDGRGHPEDPDATFYGHSIGKWEGDTLVVDSVGFSDMTLLAPGVAHSDQLRIVERIRKVDPQWLEIELTLHDPVVLEEPYTTKMNYRHLDDELREYICLENNRDGADEQGRSLLRLE